MSFRLNQAAKDYATSSGKGFNMTLPVDPGTVKYVENLPMLSRIVGRARGEASWQDGFWDKGGIVISDGRETQELPIDFLEKSGALNDPGMSQFVKQLMATKSK
jgi:hypothetical protein